MSDPVVDPLLLGQRVVAILETGLRTATYKLRVPIGDLAHRVLEIYWRQVRSFYGQELRQSTRRKEHEFSLQQVLFVA